ncbi:putative major facilitator superfamily transporter protein [Eutypa lata UCREL1]|uniref:Putative major facilitator superfamily transporter protein n=1 Tax=Eutypa lata (strain UCR-EL1) TaxID=1287681 RepID=M7TRK5_EUTLA|nr:putative major facilitator superfamily transporter protein [Eutypa lata UCREL1]
MARPNEDPTVGKNDFEVSASTPGTPDVQVGSIAERDERQKDTVSKKILRIIWDSLDKPPEERKFVQKIDIWIMSYVTISYFVKYLDQTNVVNAYVSGMKEDLGMSGQDYNLLQTMFTAGYCIGNLPSQLIMTRIRPSIWLPALELIWGFLVMGMAGAKSVKTLYVLRFFIGLLEASAYPGILTLLGNWYTPQELGKRSSIFIASAMVSQMFSGYLQAGLYSGMDGKHGLAAWQWLFIFDGVIGTPVALCGFFAIPDSPTTTKARWLKPEDRELAISRMQKVGRKPPRKLTWRVFRQVFQMWPVYLFSIVFSAQLLGIRIYNYFTIYLKDTGLYTVEQVNLIPTGAFAFQAVLALIYAWTSDAIHERAPVIAFAACFALIGTIILSVYPEQNHTAMMAGWFLTYAQTGASALIMSYVNELLSFSAEHRLIVIGVVETSGFVMNAWVILFTYPSGEAPRFTIGYEMASMFFALEAVMILVIWYCTKRWKPALPAEM